MRHAALEYSLAVSRLSLWQSFLPVQETELVVALDLFSKVGRHACKFAQSAAGQTGWRDHTGLLVLPAVGICDPSEALPPVCPVLVATGRKTIQPYCPESKYDLLSVQRVRCCNCCFSNLPPVLFFHIVLYPCRQLATQTVQLQSRICPPRSTNVVLKDFFSRFVLSFLTTPQSRPLGSEVSGRPIFTTIYNPERVILVATILYCIMLLTPLCIALRLSCLVYSIQSQEFPMMN